ncbi:MAG: LamG domain-containing protein [archaeon]
MQNKRGISAVVATVLIILITVAAVAIIWAAIIPMIKTNLELGTACLEADILIDAGSGYTCYDAENKIVAVQVKKGANEVNISKIEFLLDSEGTSRKITKLFDLSSNIGKTFYLIADEDTEGVSIAPVIKISNKEEVCDISSNIKLSKCSLNEDVIKKIFSEQGIVGFWRFEDDAEDFAGDNDGTIYGNPVFIEGRNDMGKALSFDGVVDYVDCGNEDSLDITNEITISAWVKPEGTIPPETMIVARVNATGINTDWRFMANVYQDNNGVNWGFRVRTSASESVANSELTSGSWYHLVVTYDRATVRFYLNGVADGTDSQTSALGTSHPVQIARGVGYAQKYFNGTIDEVMIYNRALSGEEVEELYESQK